MAPELRKRKEPPPPAATASITSKPAAKKRASTKSASATPIPAKPSSDTKPTKASSSSAAKSNGAPSVGNTLPLDELRAMTIQSNDGDDTSLPALLEKSADKSIAIFTYPKASTPGCTTQACLFRDSYEDLHPSFEVYGLSNDSLKSNTNFKEKQKLPYTLLCDPKRGLISKLGFGKDGGGTTRGVVVIDKDGKILAWTTGGPQPTVDAVKALMEKNEAKL